MILKSNPVKSTETSKNILGSFDGFINNALRGWAASPDHIEKPVTVSVFIDKNPVGHVVASEFRPDLEQSELKSGKHGFTFRVPEQYCDGGDHVVRVVNPETGVNLPNSPRKIRFPDRRTAILRGASEARIKGEVRLEDGCFLHGWVSGISENNEIESVRVFENGEELGFASLSKADDGRFQFSLRLPTAVCDGLPHAFFLTYQGQSFTALATITPFIITPDAVLRDYADAALLGRLSNSASRRYAALDEQVTRLAAAPAAGGPDGAFALRDIVAAHAALVETVDEKRKAADYAPFAFPETDQPLASILIPVHNKFAYTYQCLAAIRLMPNETPLEVIVLDDASTDITTELESIIGGVQVLRNPTPLGFVRNNNAGARHARGRFLVLLNNDTEVSPHWLDHLLRPFALFDRVGLVGAKLIFPDGKLQEAGGLVWRDGSVWNYGRGGNPQDPRYNYLRETDYCSAACIAIEKNFWDELGGFDDTYAPAYFEDTDLAFRVRAAGRRVLYQPLCEVVHFEGVSSGTDPKAGIKRYQTINRSKFLARWSGAMAGNGLPDHAPDYNKERGYCRRVLVLDHEFPQPDRSAGHYAAIQEIRLLQSLGFKPTFVPENLAHLGPYTSRLMELGVECVYAPFALSVEEVLAERGAEFELVYITRYEMARNIIDAVRRWCPQAKVLFNNADLHFLRLLRMALLEKSQEKLEEVCKVRDAELEVMRKVDLTLSYNETEHAIIVSHNLDSSRVAKCPWVVEPKSRVPPFSDRRDIAFLGGFRHPPNLEAVTFFVRDVMPLLRTALPGVRFRVYGSAAPTALYDLAADDVVIEGFVENLADLFDTCRIFVAPLLSGAGIKGKVLDALAYGVPSVLSPVAAEATGIRDGLEAVIAREPDDWVAAITRLYEDPEVWTAMSGAALAFVRDFYSFEAGRKAMQAALSELDLVPLEGMYARGQ